MSPESAAKFDRLLSGAYQVFVETNPQRPGAQSVSEYLPERLGWGQAPEDAEEDLADLPAGWQGWRTLCILQVYPRTSVGFWTVYGETLDGCLAQVHAGDLVGVGRA